MNDIIYNLKSNELRGLEAHAKMSPVDLSKYRLPTNNYKKASVMLLLYPKNNELHLCYMKRQEIEGDKHSGQISFPGGQMEDSDNNNFEHCALRECEEEIGVSRNDIEIIKPLSPMYVFVSNFMVHPFIGYSSFTPSFELQTSEVKNIIEVPLSYLQNPNIIGRTNIHIRNTVMKDVPYYDIFGDILWGATAMMTSEFLDLLS